MGLTAVGLIYSSWGRRSGAHMNPRSRSRFFVSARSAAATPSCSNHPRWKRHTGVCAGVFITLYITFEAPLSGMSMNPARSLGSALCAGRFDALWVYFVAPPIGMLLGAELYTRLRERGHEACAKLQHDSRVRCIFCGAPASGFDLGCGSQAARR